MHFIYTKLHCDWSLARAGGGGKVLEGGPIRGCAAGRVLFLTSVGSNCLCSRMSRYCFLAL